MTRAHAGSLFRIRCPQVQASTPAEHGGGPASSEKETLIIRRRLFPSGSISVLQPDVFVLVRQC